MDSEYSGELFINDQLITGQKPLILSQIRNEKIGFVFQFHYLLSEFTVLENVMLPAKKLGKKSLAEIKHDAMTKLKLLDMEDQASKLTYRLSGGQKQRVAIARALINNPIIIMGDEPTGNLDSKNAETVFNIFKELSEKEKLSLLVVTHDVDFAKKTIQAPLAPEEDSIQWALGATPFVEVDIIPSVEERLDTVLLKNLLQSTLEREGVKMPFTPESSRRMVLYFGKACPRK
jgi:ABC-type lipoprotein export system ATPase subunit